MPHLVRSSWNGNFHFAVDYSDDPKRRHERLGTTASADIIPITEKQARRGIDKLRKQYFPDKTARRPIDALVGLIKTMAGGK